MLDQITEMLKREVAGETERLAALPAITQRGSLKLSHDPAALDRAAIQGRIFAAEKALEAAAQARDAGTLHVYFKRIAQHYGEEALTLDARTGTGMLHARALALHYAEMTEPAYAGTAKD